MCNIKTPQNTLKMRGTSWLCMGKLKYSMSSSRLSASTIIKNDLEFKIINRLGGVRV